MIVDYTSTASQMWLLGRLLPLMIGTKVPRGDVHWECYIQLLRIITVPTSQSIRRDMIGIFRILIEKYLALFNYLYPGNITPKFHYLLHLPYQMKQFVYFIIL